MRGAPGHSLRSIAAEQIGLECVVMGRVFRRNTRKQRARKRAKLRLRGKMRAEDFTEIGGETKPTFIDLFCGCGGFTLGMLRGGFRCLAAIDSNAESVDTLHRNLHGEGVEHVLLRDLTRYSPEALSKLIGTRRIDVIIGGPPCQGFSTARQVDGANHGSRLKPDARRFLYRKFLRYVEFFRPKVFVIENVLGLRSAAGGVYLTRVQHEARNLGGRAGQAGYRVHGQVEDAWRLGVPQKRRRQLIIGVRADLPGYLQSDFRPAPRAQSHVLLGAAIGDLPSLVAGGGEDECAYDLELRAKHLLNLGESARRYLIEVLEVDRAQILTNHVARPHSPRDLRDFARLREGETSAVAMRERGVAFEFPYDKSVFKDRFTRQCRRAPCSTIVAHLSKDGLMFVHPTQCRSLTPREAARIQSFPDWFRFPSARTQAYKQIGNAVPPLVGEAVAIAVSEFLAGDTRVLGAYKRAGRNPVKHWNKDGCGQDAGREAIPISWNEAIRDLECIALLDRRALGALPRNKFVMGWHTLLRLFPDLHPNNALDHGVAKKNWPDCGTLFPNIPLERRKRYTRSGWPVFLEELGREAWRRRKLGMLESGEIYASDSCEIATASGAAYLKA